MCSFAFEGMCGSAFRSERGLPTLEHSSWAPAGGSLILEQLSCCSSEKLWPQIAKDLYSPSSYK